MKPPLRSPNLNAYVERFVPSVKESCLERLICSSANLVEALKSFLLIITVNAIITDRESTHPRRAEGARQNAIDRICEISTDMANPRSARRQRDATQIDLACRKFHDE